MRLGLIAVICSTASLASAQVDRLDQLNAIYAAPDGQATWPLYREAFLTLTVPPEALREAWPDIEPEDEAWPLLLEYIDANAQAIALLRHAADRPVLGANVSWTPDPEVRGALEAWIGRPLREDRRFEQRLVFTASLDYKLVMQHLGNLTRSLIVAAEHADLTLSEALILKLRIAGHDISQFYASGGLPGITGLSALTKAAVHRESLSAGECLDVIAAMDRVRPLEGMRDSVEYVEVFYLDLQDHCFDEDGVFTPDGAALLLSLGVDEPDADGGDKADVFAALHADRDATSTLFEESMRIARQWVNTPAWEWSRPTSDERVTELTKEWRFALAAYVRPRVVRVASLAEYQECHRQAYRAVMALRAFELDRGRQADTLDELVPEYLPELPLDRYSGEPLIYEPNHGPEQDGFLLYSVGPDGDDDGGEGETGYAIFDHLPARIRTDEAPDGDVVFSR
jgi:hypothetical protein